MVRRQNQGREGLPVKLEEDVGNIKSAILLKELRTSRVKVSKPEEQSTGLKAGKERL